MFYFCVSPLSTGLLGSWLDMDKGSQELTCGLDYFQFHCFTLNGSDVRRIMPEWFPCLAAL